MSPNDGETKASHGNDLETVVETRAKFGPDGRPLYFPGATILCHLREGDAIYRSIVDNCFDATGNAATFSKYVQLPKDSLHMTLYDVRVYHETFRAEVPTTAAEREENRAADMIEFRRGFSSVRSEFEKSGPIKMTIDPSPTRYPKPSDMLHVPLKPYSEEDADKLRSLRELIRSTFNLAPLDPAYKFHITVYYALHHLSAEQFSTLRETWSQSVKRIAEAVPVFEIDRIELCSFESMFHFHVEETISLEL